MKLLKTICLLVAALDATAVFAVNIADDCVDCHDAPTVSSTHEPVTSLSVHACIECHAAKPGDPFVRVMHKSHLDQGFECSDCHGDNPPERAELDKLLQETAAP
jgi:hypothetical protein